MPAAPVVAAAANAPDLEVRETTLTWTLPAALSQGGTWTLRGVSRSTEATSFYIPELGWSLDAGAGVNTTRPDRIFVTHTHNDHVHNLPRMRSRRKPPVITVPAHATGLVEDFLLAAQMLTTSGPVPEGFVWTRAYDLEGVAPGMTLSLGRGLVADVIACDHSVPCVGYRFSRVVDRLKPEFLGRPGAELGALRRQGAALTTPEKTPLFAFLGDTTPRVYERHPEILACPLIIGECTFLDPDHREGAWQRMHTHWADLSPIIAAHPQTHFVLTHFSLRYSTADILRFFSTIDLPNITPWVAPGDLR